MSLALAPWGCGHGVLDITMADGEWLDSGTQTLPNVVLGSVAADRLAIRDTSGAPQVYLSGVYFTVVGIVDPVPLAPSINRAAIIGESIAEQLFDFEGTPDRVFVRTGSHVPDDPELLDSVRTIMAATVRPQAPAEIQVTRPSDLIAAREYTEAAFTGLLLGLGGVALLVGGIAAALAIGALAGIYPAVRAARTDPAQAVHPTV